MSELEFEDAQEAPPEALRSIIHEVRGAGPDIDWERLEAKLFDDSGEVRAAVRPQPVTKKNRYVAIGVGLALAAAFAVALVSPTATMDARKPAPVVAARAALVGEDGHTITPGEKIVAGNGTWIRSEKRIAVRLEPGTIATVLDVGERVHLSLEKGAVSADVVPVAGGEPFAVDVAGKRVAVHGTRLRVARLTATPGVSDVEVAVSEGSAVVGAPRGAGRTEGTIVAAGSVGHFGNELHVTPNKELATRLVEDALSAKPSAPTAPTVAAIEELQPKTTSTVGAHPQAALPKPATTAVDPAPTSAPPAVEPPKPPPGLTSAQMSAPLAKLDAALAKCARKCPANVVCQYEQTLTITVDTAGKASLVSADPGLDSGDRACWSGVVSGIEFPSAPGSTTTQHHVVLGNK